MRNRSERRVKGRCSAHRSTYAMDSCYTKHRTTRFPPHARTARQCRSQLTAAVGSCRPVGARCTVALLAAVLAACGLLYASALSAFQSLSDCVFMLYNRNIVACACLISSLLKLPGFKVVAPCSCTPYGSPHTVHTTWSTADRSDATHRPRSATPTEPGLDGC